MVSSSITFIHQEVHVSGGVTFDLIGVISTSTPSGAASLIAQKASFHARVLKPPLSVRRPLLQPVTPRTRLLRHLRFAEDSSALVTHSCPTGPRGTGFRLGVYISNICRACE
jgi:hypothetical protein